MITVTAQTSVQKSVARHENSSKLTEFEQFCQEKCARFSCAKLIERYLIRLAALIAAKGGSIRYPCGLNMKATNKCLPF